MTKQLIVCSDFDGTMTRCKGERRVNSDFAKTLFNQGPSLFEPVPIKGDEELQRLLNAHFGPYTDKFDWWKPDTELLIDPQALSFLGEFLLNEGVKLFIITRSDPQYVKALLRYQGFTAFDKIQILTTQNKQECVKQHLPHNDGQHHVMIIEDHTRECQAMITAAEGNGYSREYMTVYCFSEGTHQWSEYQTAVYSILSGQSVATTASYATMLHRMPAAEEHGNKPPNIPSLAPLDLGKSTLGRRRANSKPSITSPTSLTPSQAEEKEPVTQTTPSA